MLNRIFVPLLAATCLLMAGTAGAEVKIGFVNIQRIVADAPQAAKAKKKIEKEFEKRNQELLKLAKQLQTLQEKLEKDGMTMSENDRHAREREFGELNREFQRKQREFKEDLNLRQNEEMAALFERVDKVLKNIAEAEKFDIIFQEAVFASQRIDLTDRIIKSLGDGAK